MEGHHVVYMWQLGCALLLDDMGLTFWQEDLFWWELRGRSMSFMTALKTMKAYAIAWRRFWSLRSFFWYKSSCCGFRVSFFVPVSVNLERCLEASAYFLISESKIDDGVPLSTICVACWDVSGYIAPGWEGCAYPPSEGATLRQRQAWTWKSVSASP